MSNQSIIFASAQLAYDNLCKRLAEESPATFARWLLGTNPGNIQVLKTELSLEPISADAITFLETSSQILHLEFQTQPTSEPPLPLPKNLLRKQPDIAIE